ncbi:MAG: agmatinase [Candidatus Syntrophonatronum acetioxidans]|uniref:Agmatinase n=1 Tax=Candidatus Syntrophonatronum acetioxidans TaxID=1795816 RepID=A0A424YFY8_9FIRM|nr:MAG: agmatinase [Candidatus Syntrophonatronum acetioxidans]
MESGRDYPGSEKVLFGAPMDYTASFRPGSRWAPQAIRQISRVLEEHSLTLGRSLEDLKYFDGGDLDLPPGNVDKSLELIEKAWDILLQEDKLPLMIGGDHLVTLPAVRAVSRHHPHMALLHLDAHADLRPHYLGEEKTHASVIYRIIKETGIKDVYQLGIRSATGEELAFARKNTRFYPYNLLAPLREIREEISHRPLYITLDIDLVDPAYAPGTGTPEPGGCTSREVLEALYLLKDLQVVGFDLVEVLPAWDRDQVTTLLAAKIVREALLAFSKK